MFLCDLIHRMSLFVYNSKQAHNSCLSLFPTLNNRGDINTGSIAATAMKEKKLARIAEAKRNRRARYEAKSNVPTPFQYESVMDIVEDKEHYMSTAPLSKSQHNYSKVTFQKERQLEFEENPDIDLLHQMFCTVDINLIYSQYMLNNYSLDPTIDALLTIVESTPSQKTFEVVNSLCVEGEWPELSSKQEKDHQEDNVTPTPSSGIYSSESEDENHDMCSELNSHSSEDCDEFVMIPSEASSTSSVISTEHNDEEGWVVLHESFDEAEVPSEVSINETDSIATNMAKIPSGKDIPALSYRDILLVKNHW